jgi:ankyrin repeat protein
LKTHEVYTLIRAVKRADVGAISRLAEAGVDVNELNQNGLTPLCIAVINGNTRVIQALIDAGADVNKPSVIGFAPLTYAAWAKKRRAASLLRSFGAKHEATNSAVEYMRRRFPDARVSFPLWQYLDP